MTTYGLLLCTTALLALTSVAWAAPDEDPAPVPGQPLTDAQVASFARIALAGITREYPTWPGQVLRSPADLKTTRELHPAFYGCFDWHSAVHGHWMLVRLLKLYPKSSVAADIVKGLASNLTEANLKAEAAYFEVRGQQRFERTYGWAWLLRLAQELRTWDDERGRTWARYLAPLEKKIVALWKAYLPQQVFPIRSGEHRDTAFGLAFALDYARAVKDGIFESLLAAQAMDYYAKDRDYPLRYEPSGHDFFSAGLNEADLMRRVLDAKAYGAWLERFLPGARKRDLARVDEPAAVSDVTDGKLVHLAGLNLTRAWTLRGIASALAKGDERKPFLEEVARAHTQAGLGYVFSGHYAGEHWLASFAVFLLTDAGL